MPKVVCAECRLINKSIMLSVIMQNVIMLSVIMLNVLAQKNNFKTFLSLIHETFYNRS